MAAVSGLIAQFHANEAERKCSRVKKQHSDKVHKQEGSLSLCVHEWMFPLLRNINIFQLV